MKTYFTSESVLPGHPDKVCDQVADAILDAAIAKDRHAFIACKVAACRDFMGIIGEITAAALPDFEQIARDVIRDIGYTQPGLGFDADTCRVQVELQKQSPDIVPSLERKYARDDAGAGDQGVSFGYACDETSDLMPLPITLAHALGLRLEQVRSEGIIDHLCPDGKLQVSVAYEDDRPVHVDTVIVSVQHDEEIGIDELRDVVTEEVIAKMGAGALLDQDTTVYINPTGRFVYGGPSVNAGLSGHKATADTYGGYGHFGGNSICGKDPSKMDRTGAYMARYLAKNIVAAGLARRCEVQLAYSIGLADPVCFGIDLLGTGQAGEEAIAKWVQDNIDLRPAMMINRFGLRRPIYRALSCYGQFGANARQMPWEQTELADRMALEIG